ncbi:MAG: putative pre6S rRNA nuclease [Candidatus Atribacteria bacterium]|nr:putative pre6S rRNA nuclease [Candidatus Atribacteria bacterium]
MKKCMAIDWGEKRIGIAFNHGTSLAFPAQVLESQGWTEDAKLIVRLAQQQKIDTIIIGLPLGMKTAQEREDSVIVKLGQEIKKLFSGKVVFFDERLTTKEAEKRLIEADVSRKKRKMIVDKISAALILEKYLGQNHER